MLIFLVQAVSGVFRPEQTQQDGGHDQEQYADDGERLHEAEPRCNHKEQVRTGKIRVIIDWQCPCLSVNRLKTGDGLPGRKN